LFTLIIYTLTHAIHSHTNAPFIFTVFKTIPSVIHSVTWWNFYYIYFIFLLPSFYNYIFSINSVI